jgi:hypothetical protein
MLQSRDLPVPKQTEKWTTDDGNNDDKQVPMEQNINNPDFQHSTTNEPYLIFQGELMTWQET